MSDRIPEEKFVTINGINLRYVDWGADGKTAMICLHGHTSQSGIFREFAETMSDYYHVYTFDQRGHGGSEWAEDGYDRERFVEDLGEIINELGLDKVVLVGHSMGGWNSVLYTPKNQSVVEKIILVDIGMEPSEQSVLMRGKRPPTPITPACLPSSTVGTSKSGYSSPRTSSHPSRDRAATFLRSSKPITSDLIHRCL